MTPDILETIDRFWEARIAGDKAAVRSFMADNCTYEMVGAMGPALAGPAADQLIDDFQFSGVKRLDSIVDGQKAAVTNRIEVCYRHGRTVTSQACDLWEFDSSGKITSLRQFVDTALVDRMTSGRA